MGEVIPSIRTLPLYATSVVYTDSCPYPAKILEALWTSPHPANWFYTKSNVSPCSDIILDTL